MKESVLKVQVLVWVSFLLALPTGRAVDSVPMKTVSPEQVSAAVEKAHGVLWSKFIGEEGLIHDFVGAIPTPEDCALGRPNAIGW
ncbi:MAG TPA: hypothetical protein P5016_16220 [Verrucomicrobiales bacterium]|nr:hypothetical protein [Verrucomicrobiales bacterium]